MERKKIEERLKQLKESRDAMQVQIGLHNGAIQDCEHWLAEIDKANVQTMSDTPGAPD